MTSGSLCPRRLTPGDMPHAQMAKSAASKPMKAVKAAKKGGMAKDKMKHDSMGKDTMGKDAMDKDPMKQ